MNTFKNIEKLKNDELEDIIEELADWRLGEGICGADNSSKVYKLMERLETEEDWNFSIVDLENIICREFAYRKIGKLYR